MTGRRFVLGDGFADEHTPPAEPGVYARLVSDDWPWAWTTRRAVNPDGTNGDIVENGPEPTDEDRARDLEAAGPPVRVGPAGPATGELVSTIADLAAVDPARVTLPFRHLLTRAAHAWLTVRRVTRPGLATWERWGTFGARGLHPGDPYNPSNADVQEGARALARWLLSDAGGRGDEVASWALDRRGDALDRWTDEAARVLPLLAERWPDAEAWASSYALSHPWAADVFGLALATVDVPGVGAVLAADGMLADVLGDVLGDEAAARVVRERSAARVARWLEPEPDLGLPGDPGAGPGDLWRAWWGGTVPDGCPVASPAIVAVLRAAWARFRPSIVEARERDRRMMWPALPAVFVARPPLATDTPQGELFGANGRPWPLQRRPGATLPDAVAIDALARTDRSVLADRFIRWLAIKVYEQSGYAGDARSVVVERGARGLAVALGSPDKGDSAEEVRDMLRALNGLRLTSSETMTDGSLALVIAGWGEVKPVAGRPASLRIDAGPLFVPGWAGKWPVVSERALLPVLPAPNLKTLHPSHRGPASRLDWLMLAAVRDRVTDAFGPDGRPVGVPLDLPALADRAELPRNVLPKALEALQSPDRWTVRGARWLPGPHLAVALLKDAADLSEGQRGRARKRNDKRRGKR